MDNFRTMSLDSLVRQWAAVDVNATTRQEILELQAKGATAELEAKLRPRISFGTAGLRASMGSGFAHMNDVTVLQASQGLVAYLEARGGTSVVVGYDHRWHSQRFAEIVVSAAVSRGMRVYYLGDSTASASGGASGAGSGTSGAGSGTSGADPGYVHTPLVPFTIDHFHASAGVMITASHNPANDNGYKVYYGNGCQIIPPVDQDIAASIDRNLEPWPGVWDVAANFKTHADLIVPVKGPMTQAYLERINRLVKQPKLPFRFVYTPMHGVGHEIFDAVARHHQWQYVVVPEQRDPDPAFPTVQFPNPEEKGALTLAMRTADLHGLSLVLASDPDADRFSVAVKIDGSWRQLTGNEIGFLFAQYVISETPKQDLHKTYLVNSTVSSQILAVMAEKEGFHFQDTLTGFKWIGNKAIDLKNQGFLVPFGYEEAIGFMFDIVNDKDGISAAVMFLQMYSKWFMDESPADRLAKGYEKYGYCKECNGYYKVDVAKVAEIFNRFRDTYEGNQPKTLGPFTVTYWRDLTLGYESSTPDNKSVLPQDAKSQMITGVMREQREEGAGEGEGVKTVRFTIRGSGTEPKLKLYIEGSGPSESLALAVASQCWTVLSTCLQLS